MDEAFIRELLITAGAVFALMVILAVTLFAHAWIPKEKFLANPAKPELSETEL